METITKSTLKDKFLSEYDLLKDSFKGNRSLHEQAISSFSKLGIPGRKHEEYKYLNFELALKGDFVCSSSKTISQEQLRALPIPFDAYLIVLVNGKFNQDLSNLTGLPEGVSITSLQEAFKKHEIITEKHYSRYADITSDNFVALNTAFANDGAFIHIAKNTNVTKPVCILHVVSSAEYLAVNSRNLVVVEENSQVKLMEFFESIDATEKIFTNDITEIVVKSNAILDHYKIQNEIDSCVLVNTTQVYQEKQSTFSTFNFTFDGGLVRNNLNIILDGEHIESHLNGLYLTTGNQQVDNHTLVDHRQPNCNSNELYKGVVDGRSTATFNGKIFVRKDAQKTNAFQSNKNILLSDDGSINTKPQLEIYADDVKCSHGTSTGKLDDAQVFYLRARGLSEMSARKLLMHAFASEVVNTVKIDQLKEYLEEKISSRFE